MSFWKMANMEWLKIRRSKIFWILLAPVVMMWLPSVLNASINFDVQGAVSSPEKNFFIQGFMGMAWFMIPATLVICTVLLDQVERGNGGILKMLSLPISTQKLCLAKFAVLLLLAAVQMAMALGGYYLSAALATALQGYPFVLDFGYAAANVLGIYASAIPMAAVYWAIAIWIKTPIFSIGLGLASIVPSVLMINTKFWFAYPISYPFYVLMVAYGRAAEGIYTTCFDWLPWLPAAVCVTIVALVLACLGFGRKERR